MEVNNNKASSILELGQVNYKKLANKVQNLNNADWDTKEDYNSNYNKHDNSVLNRTSHIILRFSNKQTNPFEYYNCSRWKEWESLMNPLIDEATTLYNYNKGVATRVMLAKLPTKSFIAPHTDGTRIGSIPHKIHIPLFTNPNSFFFIENEKFHLKEGIAYEVNNSIKHSAVNNGETERIHLIFEFLDYEIQSKIIQKQINNLY